MCLDNRYAYDEVREIRQGVGFTAHIRSRGEEAKDLALGCPAESPLAEPLLPQPAVLGEEAGALARLPAFGLYSDRVLRRPVIRIGS